ncbi:DUF3883 domain-containing protein [Terrabacter sp. LjRoot27]|uniref:protein NO VEIN domain-containing protein n=1 Tax=Terrabacter sp. LjRoot27 TaxID=3342306 RepID=UPI003ECCD0EE
MTEKVIRKAGLPWYTSYDSRASASGGGSTVARAGMAALVEALRILLPSAASEDSAATPRKGEPKETGQGRVIDPERRKKIEDAAQDWLMDHYRDQGFHVTDTRIGNPFDAVAEKHGAVLYLEAKGTTGQGATVLVTRNEVAWARTHLGLCYIGIWSGMVFDSNGDIDPVSGNKEVYYWDPEDTELVPIDYEWHVPESKEMWPHLNYD